MKSTRIHTPTHIQKRVVTSKRNAFDPGKSGPARKSCYRDAREDNWCTEYFKFKFSDEINKNYAMPSDDAATRRSFQAYRSRSRVVPAVDRTIRSAGVFRGSGSLFLSVARGHTMSHESHLYLRSDRTPGEEPGRAAAAARGLGAFDVYARRAGSPSAPAAGPPICSRR